jgi:selenocysteine lyase/cysteine desulfurase
MRICRDEAVAVRPPDTVDPAAVLKPLSEKDWTAQVREMAEMRGWLEYHPYRSDRSTPGYPDLTLVRAPRVVFAELKTDKRTAKLSQSQKIWMSELGQCPGVEVYLWRPADLDKIQEILST